MTSTGILLPGSLGRGPLQEDGCREMHKFRACMDYCKCMPCGGEGWISHNLQGSENAVAALGQGLAVHPTLASNFQPYFQHTVITGVHLPHPGKSYGEDSDLSRTHTGENTSLLVLALVMSTISAEHRAITVVKQGSFEARTIADEDRIMATAVAAGKWPIGLSTCGFLATAQNQEGLHQDSS